MNESLNIAKVAFYLGSLVVMAIAIYFLGIWGFLGLCLCSFILLVLMVAYKNDQDFM